MGRNRRTSPINGFFAAVKTLGSLGSDETDSPGLPGRMPPGPEDHKDAGWGQASGSHGPARSRAALRTAYAAQSGPGTAALSRSRIHLWCPTSRKIWGSQGFRLLARPGQRTPQRYRWPRGERPAKRPQNGLMGISDLQSNRNISCGKNICFVKTVYHNRSADIDI